MTLLAYNCVMDRLSNPLRPLDHFFVISNACKVCWGVLLEEGFDRLPRVVILKLNGCPRVKRTDECLLAIFCNEEKIIFQVLNINLNTWIGGARRDRNADLYNAITDY